MAQLFILYDVTRAICQTYFVCTYNIISIYYLLYYNIFPTLYLPCFFHSVIIIIISRAVGSPHYSRGTKHYNITRKYICCLKSENVIKLRGKTPVRTAAVSCTRRGSRDARAPSTRGTSGLRSHRDLALETRTRRT